MGFDRLLGNNRLKDNLITSIRRERISHFYLISGPTGSGKKTLAQLLSAAILCENTDRPCLSCPACRKVLADTHPDYITVHDPEHKNVSVAIVRQAREDVFVRPNEANRKIYLFPQELGTEGQNALLKILEEPPSYGVFILLSDNPEKLLPTIRSRCTLLQLQSLPEDILLTHLQQEFPGADMQTLSAAINLSGGYLGQALQLLRDGVSLSVQAETFVRSFAQRDCLALIDILVPMEKWKRDQLLPELACWTALLQQALVCRSGAVSLSPLARELSSQRSSSELLQALCCLQKAIEYIQGNVSTAAVCGWLLWSLR